MSTVRTHLSLVPTGWTAYELPKAPKRKERDVIQSHKTNPVYLTRRGLKGPHRVRPLEGLPSFADKGTHYVFTLSNDEMEKRDQVCGWMICFGKRTNHRDLTFRPRLTGLDVRV
ncbi:hypothetical protein AVEN_265175-1 [Araneus ventricosus]|uniref:Uncharacterized protein n=1 Tax=Araneus ventricosus TaxID=182803 RepID=A0A4Y2CQP6_ARAVE|nr:hypothetical protein AVEN_265175-1 [Araneus ventricosus]